MPARVHQERGQRGHHPRPAADVLGQLKAVVAAVVALGVAAGCDSGPKTFEDGPPLLNLIGSDPAPGQGSDCLPDDPVDCGVPIDTAITFRFDRFLLPAAAVRQSFDLYTGTPANAVAIWLPHYDVVERVVRFDPPAGRVLEPGTLYTVELRSARSDAEFGFRAFDGAPLSDGELPTKFNFRTRRSEERLPPTLPPESVTCDRVLELFASAGCTSQSCHGGETPSMGLGLGSGLTLRETAISEVAHQTERGAESGVPLRDPSRFGIQMPVIDPGEPANSYLMYKLLRNPESYRLSEREAAFCDTLYSAPLGENCLEPPTDEMVRLREWFVLGSPMPPGGHGRPLYRGELDEIARFIATGADCR